jgi:hypothetical protein
MISKLEAATTLTPTAPLPRAGLERELAIQLAPGAAVEDFRFPGSLSYFVRADGTLPSEAEILALADELDDEMELEGEFEQDHKAWAEERSMGTAPVDVER